MAVEFGKHLNKSHSEVVLSISNSFGASAQKLILRKVLDMGQSEKHEKT